MATRSAAMPADAQRPRPLFTVTIGIGHFEWMCQTGAGTIIEPELMLPYLSRAEIERMIFDPPNRKLEASTKTLFTSVMRKIIGLRDQHCQHPSGCDEPVHKCDVDHIDPRSCSGITYVCLLAQPEPANGEVDTCDDEGDWKLCRIPDPDNPNGSLRLDEFRRRYAA